MAREEDYSVGFLKHYASLDVLPEEHRAQLAVAAKHLESVLVEIEQLREAARTGVRCMEQRNEAYAEIESLRGEIGDKADAIRLLKKQCDELWATISDTQSLHRQRIRQLETQLASERGCSECWLGYSCGGDCHMNDVALQSKDDDCDWCGGTQRLADSDGRNERDCPECVTEQGRLPCPDLGRSGHNHPADPCAKCNGTGWILLDDSSP